MAWSRLPELNRVERRALGLATALVLIGSAARLGLAPGEAAYSWRPAPESTDEGTPAGARAGVEAALAREERANRPLGPGERLDPNAVPEEELRRLPGIGPARARAIVAAREGSPFRTTGDLLRVPGIGEATLARLAPHLALPAGPPRRDAGRAGAGPGAADGAGGARSASPSDGRLDVNAASVEELERLPGIGPSRARQIVRTRERLGRFRSVDQLIEVPGIGPVVLERLRDRVVVR